MWSAPLGGTGLVEIEETNAAVSDSSTKPQIGFVSVIGLRHYTSSLIIYQSQQVLYFKMTIFIIDTSSYMHNFCTTKPSFLVYFALS